MANDVKSYQIKDFIIEIDCDKCISCGTCAALAPKTFKLDKNYKSTVLPPPNDSNESILDVARSCAVEAITIIDKKSNKKLYPG